MVKDFCTDHPDISVVSQWNGLGEMVNRDQDWQILQKRLSGEESSQQKFVPMVKKVSKLAEI